MSNPNPGSAEAVKNGCLCPVIDNAGGHGYMGGARDRHGETVFVMREDCPLHGNKDNDNDSRKPERSA